MDNQFVVTIRTVKYTVSNTNFGWSIVNPLGTCIAHYPEGAIPTIQPVDVPLAPICRPFQDGKYTVVTAAATAPYITVDMIPVYPPKEPNGKRLLRFLHGRIVADVNEQNDGRRTFDLLAKLYYKTRRRHKIEGFGQTSFWRQVSLEPSWGRKFLDRHSELPRETQAEVESNSDDEEGTSVQGNLVLQINKQTDFGFCKEDDVPNSDHGYRNPEWQ